MLQARKLPLRRDDLTVQLTGPVSGRRMIQTHPSAAAVAAHGATLPGHCAHLRSRISARALHQAAPCSSLYPPNALQHPLHSTLPTLGSENEFPIQTWPMPFPLMHMLLITEICKQSIRVQASISLFCGALP